MSAALQERPACPLCASSNAAVVCDGLRDLLSAKEGEFALVRCSGCALAYLSPRPTRERIGWYYEGVYGEQAEKLQTGVLASLSDRARLRDLRSRVALGAGARHLEVGAGFGAFVTRLCASTGASAVAIDFGDAQVDAVTRRAREGGLRIEARKGELATIALAGGAFDSAAMLHYLEHSFDPCGDLWRAHAALRGGGAIVVEVPNVDALGHRWFGRFWAAHLAPQHLTAWSAATLTRALREAGFRDVRVRGAYLPFLLLLSLLQWWHWNVGGASRFKGNVLIANAGSAIFFLLFGVPLALLDLLLGPILARTARAEVIRATAIK